MMYSVKMRANQGAFISVALKQFVKHKRFRQSYKHFLTKDFNMKMVMSIF